MSITRHTRCYSSKVNCDNVNHKSNYQNNHFKVQQNGEKEMKVLHKKIILKRGWNGGEEKESKSKGRKQNVNGDFEPYLIHCIEWKLILKERANIVKMAGITKLYN